MITPILNHHTGDEHHLQDKAIEAVFLNHHTGDEQNPEIIFAQLAFLNHHTGDEQALLKAAAGQQFSKSPYR